MDFIKQVESIFRYTFLGFSTYKLIIFIFLTVLTLTLRKFVVSPVMMLLTRLAVKKENQVREQFIRNLELPINFLFILAGLWLAFEVLELSGDAKQFWEHLLRSALAFLVFWAVYRSTDIFASMIRKAFEKSELTINSMLLSFMKSGMKVLIVIMAALVIIEEWGYNAAGFLAGLGLGGLAIALAAKDTLANFFGSIMIMLDRPFDVGDWIMTPQTEGTVEHVGFRSTRIRTFAQALVTIPNSMMSNEPVTNWSRMGKRRINFRLCIAYDTPPSSIKACVCRIREMLGNHPEVHPDTILVYLERFSESSLEIFIYLFTTTTSWQKFLEVQEEINFGIMDILEEMKISIARPTRTVYIEQNLKD